MNNSKRIKAFTLTELLVVIIISAIVVGLALSVLDLLQENYSRIRENYTVSTEITHIQQQLSLDFNRYHEITLDDKLKRIHLKNPIDSVVYTYSNGLLVRQEDSTFLPIEIVNSYFNGTEVFRGQIDALELYVGEGNQTQLFIYKTNDAKTFLIDGH